MKNFILFITSSLILLSCNNINDKSSQKQEPLETHTAQIINNDSIELENGEKWTVNKEMKPFVLNGEDLVNTYIQENKTNYKELAKQLSEQNNQLIKNCTMQGKSHEELHKWLHPHLELVKQLETENNPEIAKEIVDQLQGSYQQYQKYFN